MLYVIHNIKLNSMKKLLVISTAIILALFTSCRSDSDNDEQQLMLTGNWRPDKIVSVSTQNGTTTTTTIVTNDCQKKGRLLFNSNLSGNVTYWDDESDTCEIALNVDFAYTFNPDTKQFTITINNNTMEGIVSTLTDNSLVVNYIDRSNPAIVNKVEISATKVAN